MKIKKLYIVIALIFLFLLLGTTISYGAYNASNASVESGANVSITVTSTEELDAYNLDLQSSDGLTFNNCSKSEEGAIISIQGSSIGYMNMSGKTKTLGTYNFTAPTVTEDKTCTITFLVNKSTPVTATVTVKAPVPEPEPEPETPPVDTTPENPGTTENTPVATKSSEARLKDFGIKPNDFKGFKRDTYSYTHEVPNDVSTVNVYAYPVDKKASVTGDGNITLKEGENTVEVTVTAEDGTQKTYTLNITRKAAGEITEEPEENESSEARLEKLWITPEEYDFKGFNKDTKTYTFEIPSEVEKITIHAEPVNSKATVKGTGEITLKDGLNEIEVEVTAGDGKTEKYLLKITRGSSATINGNTFGLSQLQIAGVTLSPKFDTEKYQYTVGLKEDIDSLEITAKSNNENATIEIIGNEDLEQGENTITILVTDSETGEVVTYQIVVNKNIIKQTAVAKVEWLKPSTWGMREKILVAAAVVLLVVIIVAIIIKVRLSRAPIDDMEFPGAEELDRALAEHEELTGEEYYIPYQGNNTDFEQEYNDYYEDDIQYNKPKRRGKHF